MKSTSHASKMKAHEASHLEEEKDLSTEPNLNLNKNTEDTLLSKRNTRS